MSVLPLFMASLGVLAHPQGTLAQVSAASCPQDVDVAGEDPANWTRYKDWSEFLSCSETPRLFKLDAQKSDDEATSFATDIRACTSFRGEDMPDLDAPWNETDFNDEEVGRDIQISWSGSSADTGAEEATTALREMSAYISVNTAEENGKTISLFAHYGDAAVGVYIGVDIDKVGAIYAVLQEAILRVEEEEIGGSFIFQYCEREEPGMAIGLSVNTGGGEAGLEAVVESVASWEQGDCVTELENSDVITGVNIWTRRDSWSGTTSSDPTGTTEVPEAVSGGLTGTAELPDASAEGTTATGESPAPTSEGPATSGKDSATLGENSATAIETSATTSNSSVSESNVSAPTSGDPVAVPIPKPSQVTSPTYASDSSFVDFMQLQAPPTPNSDGSCAFYYVRPGENCYDIARDHGISVADIVRFNEGRTWGFKQCEGMPFDIFICLSEGFPPLPPAELGVQCGPKVPGTKLPTDGTSIADLNPCPLNACCSQFGYCGTTAEFCEVTGDVLGVSGCVSNCGRGITNNREPPAEFISIGYFESWNQDRACLTMGIDEIDTDKFTHVHFAFGNITRDFEIDMGGYRAEPFEKFVQLNGTKRIVSFGGWADSNDPDISQMWRDAVGSQRSRTRLAQNLVDFVDEYDLDGIDIDWEYPAAPEIPNLSDEPTEGEGYLSLLALLRLLLPKGKSLSIAAPASYWYLRGYPIQEMADYLDYIVFMSYDLHGQWDAGSDSSQSGCLDGNCLRSHVNFTETIDALSMITRAGVPASKVAVGVTSYGRSFLMAEPGCTGPMCRFLGDNINSPAKMGPCTVEAGLLANAEIDLMPGRDPGAYKWYDNETMSNYAVYDSVQWVAYMDAETKAARTSLYRALNFGGTSDWAIDLQTFGRNESMTREVFAEIAEGEEDDIAEGEEDDIAEDDESEIDEGDEFKVEDGDESEIEEGEESKVEEGEESKVDDGDE